MCESSFETLNINYLLVMWCHNIFYTEDFRHLLIGECFL